MKTNDAFVSHSSADDAVAQRIRRSLEPEYRIWLDTSDIRLGALLRNELQQAIAASRIVGLLWSEAAAASRWVAAEIITAFHLDRFIVPCVLDTTPLPHFLSPAVYLDLGRDEAGGIEQLRRALRDAPDAANELPPRMVSRSADLEQAVAMLAQGQQAVIARIRRRDRDGARQIQEPLWNAMRTSVEAWPYDTMVLNLAGYQYKNEYQIVHFDEIQAGQPPRDPLLDRAERCFLDALFVDPDDLSALNGLGSILILERELDAAEFFVRRAIDLATHRGLDYSAARNDLAEIQRFKPNDSAPT